MYTPRVFAVPCAFIYYNSIHCSVIASLSILSYVPRTISSFKSNSFVITDSFLPRRMSGMTGGINDNKQAISPYWDSFSHMSIKKESSFFGGCCEV